MRKADLNFESKEKEVEAKEEFRGKTFVLTGKLEKYTRPEAKSLIEGYGGRVTSSISKSTDVVIAGKDPGSKLDNAKKYNIKIVGEEEFEAMVNE